MTRLDEIVRALESDDMLSDIVIGHSEQHDIGKKVQMNLARGTGLLVLVSPEIMTTDSPDSPGPHFDNANIIIEVTENPTLNRGENKPTGWDIACRIAFYLHVPNHGLADGLETPVQAVMDLGLVCISLSQRTDKNVVVNQLRFQGAYTIEMNQN